MFHTPAEVVGNANHEPKQKNEVRSSRHCFRPHPLRTPTRPIQFHYDERYVRQRVIRRYTARSMRARRLWRISCRCPLPSLPLASCSGHGHRLVGSHRFAQCREQVEAAARPILAGGNSWVFPMAFQQAHVPPTAKAHGRACRAQSASESPRPLGDASPFDIRETRRRDRRPHGKSHVQEGGALRVFDARPDYKQVYAYKAIATRGRIREEVSAKG